MVAGARLEGRALVGLCAVREHHRPARRCADSATDRLATRDQDWISVGVSVDLPDAADFNPTIHITNFIDARRQPFHLVIFGEKSSLSDVVLPIAREFGADCYLETGEISDSHLFTMAQRNAADSRPLRVFTLSDFDPSGWQMPISIGRKLQALRDLRFPQMQFEVRAVALTVDQARDFDLPSMGT